ncbi:MAG: KdsC family phosphatase [Planctomycetota bacterium]|jgi:3-deoxy-D-manno-octulosonate 8-phosphate phosphatase (KDO 8-P phosphatase)
MPLRDTKLLIIDVDGTMTDGKIYIDSTGNEIKAFSAHDGSALALLKGTGIRVAFITGRESQALDKRARELGVEDVFQGVQDKIKVLTELAAKYKLALHEVACIGDDFTDLPVMRQVGYSFAVANARESVKEFAHYVTEARGGEGAVSEAVMKLLKAQGLYDSIVDQYLS